MYKCSNCESEFGPGITITDGLVIRQGETVVGAVCPECVYGVKTCKVVLKRNPIGRLVYDPYSALEMEQRAFGKR
jgi:DNA-directed RNA polymerase subunit RPC12/RpoP